MPAGAAAFGRKKEFCERRKKGRYHTKKFIRRNRQIRAEKIRLIDKDGNQLGVTNLYDAIKMAQEAGLDLVEVAPNVNPPVCRILDYSKFKYEQEKREREAKKKQHVMHVKELKIGPMIEEHDYQVKLNHLKRFLERGDKVKVSMRFRGRQMEHIDLGRNVLDRLIKDSLEAGEVEKTPSLEGRMMTMAFAPKKH
ncbi:MAG: translation initiation factor IF-3 [Candidatus Omnitrophica bacterium]|nr:translation initiation factor IF-3 [Candidatus Omnitrophota bacterium]